MRELTFKLRAKKKDRKKQPNEATTLYNIHHILRKVKTGDLDLTKKHQRAKINLAIKHGYLKEVDGEFIILKEDSNEKVK